jgi:hypothetical protein
MISGATSSTGAAMGDRGQLMFAAGGVSPTRAAERWPRKLGRICDDVSARTAGRDEARASTRPVRVPTRAALVWLVETGCVASRGWDRGHVNLRRRRSRMGRGRSSR